MVDVSFLGHRATAEFRSSRVVRYAAIVVFAVLIGIGVNHVAWAVMQWPLGDLKVYLAAGERLRAGEPLYLLTDPYNTFWYAPWFAFAFVPLTFLPQTIVAVGWSMLLVGCSVGVGAVLWRAGGRASLALAALAVPALFAVSAGGNVQAPLVLALLLALHRTSGPGWIAIAASLKFTPILFALVYAARGEWKRAAITVVATAALIGPALALGLPLGHVEAWQGAAPSILAWGIPIYVGAVGVCCVAAFLVPARYSALPAATGAVLALPRLFVYDVTLLVAGAADDPADRRVPGQRSE